MERIKRKSRPSMEGLEGRMLLNGSHGQAKAAVHADATGSAPAPITRFNYSTGDGAKVQIQLNGPGTLAGTTAPGGVLTLVYSGTTVFSSIIGTVKGGSGQVPLATIRPDGVPLNSLTGLGGDLLGRVLLPSFNLIGGGQVNLLPGVQVFTLNSVATNSQVHLRDTPLNTSLGVQSYVNTVTGAGTGFAKLSASSTGATSSSASGLLSGTSIGTATGSTGSSGFTVVNPGTLDPVAIGFGGGTVGAINGKIPIINTIGNGQNHLGTPGLSQSQVDQGRNDQYVTDSAGGTKLSSIGGTFMPGPNLIEPSDFSMAGGNRVPPPGVVVTIKHVNGGPTSKTPPLGDSQIYGYDATANQLIRFDTATGAQTLAIALPPGTSSTGVGGVSLARNGAELVVLVGTGTNVLAYDAVTGVAVGQFSTANLSIGAVDGIGTGGQTTMVATAATAQNPAGTVQAIDLAGSLASADHQAVATGSSFSPNREFALAGTITGVPGTGNLYALGSAFFDTAQPNIKQAGILTINPGTGTTPALAESSRTALTSNGLDLPAGTNNGVGAYSSLALGSLDSFLALDTGVVNGQNVVNLFTPNGLTSQGSFKLNDANPLADLSQSFHPELAGTALIDVQGNVQSFTSRTATGMVLNDAGNLNLLQINNASNSTVIGLPFGHVSIPVRNNVSITTNSRLIGTRGDVTVNASQKQVGPLFLA